MVNSVETEHRGKLEQLNNIQKEQSISLEMNKVHMPNKMELISGIKTTPFNETDELFHGLGLGNYVTEKDVTKTATELVSQPVFMQSTSQPNSAKKTQNFLSLEQKEQLAREQDKQQKLKAQPTLQSQPAVQHPASKKPMKDLTSSLMQSNLMNITLPGSSPMNSSVRPSQQIVTPNYNLGAEPKAFHRPVSLDGAFQSNGSTSNPGWLATSSSNMKSPTYSANESSQIKPNMNSLDNLLKPNRTSKMSMNQMATSQMLTVRSPPGNLIRPMGGAMEMQQDSRNILSSTSTFPSVPATAPPPHSNASSELFDLLG